MEFRILLFLPLFSIYVCYCIDKPEERIIISSWADDTQQLCAGQLCTTNYITGFVIHKISVSLLSKRIPFSSYFAVYTSALSVLEAGESRGLLVPDCWLFSSPPIYKTLTSLRCNILLIFSCLFCTFLCLPLATVYLTHFHMMPHFILLQYNFSSWWGLLFRFIFRVSFYLKSKSSNLKDKQTVCPDDSLMKGGTPF